MGLKEKPQIRAIDPKTEGVESQIINQSINNKTLRTMNGILPLACILLTYFGLSLLSTGIGLKPQFLVE